MAETVTKRKLTNALKKLGLGAGMNVMVHSSLSRFGHVDGGAETVIEALLETVHPDGTVFMPVMTFGTPFNVRSTPSQTGLVTETFRQRADTVRSLSPTHSIVGVGPDAERILAGHDTDLPYGPNGPGSPLEKLLEEDAAILLMGVSHDRNTMAHMILYYLDHPFLEQWREVEVTDDDGSVRKVRVRHPGCGDGFANLDKVLDEEGVQLKLKVGDAVLRFVRARDLVKVGMRAVRWNPMLLFCGRFDCPFCGYAASDLDI